MLTSSPRHITGLVIGCCIIIALYLSNIRPNYNAYNASEKLSQWSKTVLQKTNATSLQHAGVFDDSTEGAPRIVQCSMQFGGRFDLMYEKGLRTHIENGEKWGYPTHYLRQDIVGKGQIADGVYDKLLYLETVMVNEMTKPHGKRAEWIVWFDADTVLLNNNVPWSIFLPPHENPFRDINMLVSRDWTGFNAGIFLIRVCEWSINLLSDAIALPRLRPDVDLPFREQDAVGYVMNMPQNKKYRIYQPRYWFNVYDLYYEGRGEKMLNGSLVVHFPGMGGARPDAMGRWLDILDRDPERLRVPLANTSYPAETEAYWSRLKSAMQMFDKTNEFREESRKKHPAAFAKDDGRIARGLEKVEDALHEIINEEAYDKDKLRQGVLAVDTALRGAKSALDNVLKQEAEEAQRRQKAAEEQRKKAEEERQRAADLAAAQKEASTSTSDSHDSEAKPSESSKSETTSTDVNKGSASQHGNSHQGSAREEGTEQDDSIQESRLRRKLRPRRLFQ